MVAVSRSRVATLALVSVAVFAPFVIYAAYLLIGHELLKWDSAAASYGSVLGAAAVGAWAVWKLCGSRPSAALRASAYFLVAIVALIFFGVSLVCTALGDCP
jgi:hypothetical protein